MPETTYSARATSGRPVTAKAIAPVAVTPSTKNDAKNLFLRPS